MEPNQQSYSQQPSYPSSDEISLIDLWLILSERKILIIAIAIFFTLLAGIIASTMPTKATFATSLKIGYVGGEQGLLETPESVVAKVTQLYIPQLRNDNKNNIKVDISNPKGSNIVLLRSTVPGDQESLVRDLHQKVIGLILQDHKSLFSKNEDAKRNAIKSLTRLLSQNSDAVQLNNQYGNSIAKLELDLSKATPSTKLTDTLLVDEKKKSIILFSTIGIILGTLLGIFAAFFAEFLRKVEETKNARMKTSN